MDEMIPSQKQRTVLSYLQYGCLLLVCVIELAYLSPIGRLHGEIWVAVNHFLAVPAMAFLVLSVAQGVSRRGKAMPALSLVMLLWFGCVQSFRVIRGMEQIENGEFICFYALALPMACAMDDGQRQRGLKTLTLTFLVEGLLLSVLGLGLRFGFLPESYPDAVRWDGARLLELFHPNNCAVMLMLGIGICLSLCFRTGKKWLRAVLILLALAQYGVQTMTNGRTSMVFTSLLVGGILFCAIRKTGWKRAPLALAAAIGVMAIMIFSSQKLFKLHEQDLTRAALLADENWRAVVMEQEPAPEETEAPETQSTKNARLPSVTIFGTLDAVNYQTPFQNHLSSLNGRTGIWKAAIEGVRNNPKLLVSGTDDVAGILSEHGAGYALHTHNSYFEVLYALGIPGLLIALAVTLLALRAAVILLWRNDDPWKSAVAIIAMCLLGCGLLEPYLFVSGVSQHYLTLFFLATVGYLHQWTTEERKPR